MNDFSPTSRIAGSGSVAWTLTAWFVAVALLIFGGQVQSLILIGAGSVVWFGSIVGINKGSKLPVFHRMLPVTLGTYLMVGGLYFESALLQAAGLLLALGYTLWVAHPDMRAFVGGWPKR